jgi:signal peptidase II
LPTIAIVGIDRISKIEMLSRLNIGESYAVLPFLNFRLAFNKGAAFSFLDHASGWQNLFFIVLALLVSIYIVVLVLMDSKEKSFLSQMGLVFILGGALGNAWDRIQFSIVIDFINLHFQNWHFAIFNVADSAITIGAFLLIWHWLRLWRNDKGKIIKR